MDVLARIRERGRSVLLSHQFLDFGSDFFRPGSVCLGAEVKIVWHVVLSDRAVFLEKFRSDIEVVDVLAIIQLGDDFVDLINLLPLWIGLFTAGENRKQQDLCLGQILAKLGNDSSDAFRDLLGAVAVRVVRPDHHDGYLRLESVDVSVLKAPQDMLGPVATDPQIERLVFREMFFPYRLAWTLPCLGDGVADEQQRTSPGGRGM